MLCAPALASPPAASEPDSGAASYWLARIRAAAGGQNYQGTMVFTARGASTSSRVAHFSVGKQAYELVEALDGRQRRVFRHNDIVHTVWPQAGIVVVERRSVQMTLPSAMQSVEPRALEQYELHAEGRERVADREAAVLRLQPRDQWRFAQRIWADVRTGLMLRADVLAPDDSVLESSRFSQVEIGVRPNPAWVLEPLRRLEGMRVLQRSQSPTRLEDEGWALVRPVPGFHPLMAYRRPLGLLRGEPSEQAPEVLQAVYSDGLTHVSLFIEPFDGERHKRDLMAQFGATHTLSLRRGQAWITVMGDVPAATLERFVDGLERRRP